VQASSQLAQCGDDLADLRRRLAGFEISYKCVRDASDLVLAQVLALSYDA